MHAITIQAALIFAALSHPSFAVREFVAIPPHVAALGLAHPDLEIRHRCGRAIDRQQLAAFEALIPKKWPRLDAACHIGWEITLNGCDPFDVAAGLALFTDEGCVSMDESTWRLATMLYCAGRFRAGASSAELRAMIDAMVFAEENYGPYGEHD